MHSLLENLQTAPQSVTLAITSRCDLNCPCCYQDQHVEDMQTKDILALIDQLSLAKVPRLLISGGEPFLRKDLFEIMGYAKEKNMEIYIATNGRLIDQKIINRLGTIGLKHMSVSANGYSAETNFGRDSKGFDKIIENIKLLAKAKFEVFVSVVVMKDNYKLLPKIFDYYYSLGIKNFWLNRLNASYTKGYYQQHALSEKDIAELIKTRMEYGAKVFTLFSTSFACAFYEQTLEWAKKVGLFGCHSCGEKTCFIDSNGDVYPCSYFHKTKYCAGNVLKTPFKEIWDKSPVLAQFRNTTDKLKGTCSTCHLKEICGGCRRLAYEVFDDIYAEDPACPMRLKPAEKQ